MVRDIDLITEIGQKAILPLELQWKLSAGAMVNFSFSTLDDREASIFEPGATPPSMRLLALRKIKECNIKSGVSLMPLLPYITDTPKRVEHFFQVFKAEEVDYLFPASITLFGNGKADSKTLLFQAIGKHYPELLPRYQSLFGDRQSPTSQYMNNLKQLFREMHQKYGLKDSLLS